MRILLADDHALLRESLAVHLMQLPEVDVVYQAAEPSGCVEVFAQYRPDLVLMDVHMPSGSAFQATRTIRSVEPGAKVIFLSDKAYDSDIQEALNAHARGILLKQDGIGLLSRAIRTVMSGGVFFSPSIYARLRVEGSQLRLVQPCSRAIAELTARERELLILLAKGASLKEAAAIMQVSYKTADNQKASLMRKLDIHDRVQLARFAIREGLVSLVDSAPTDFRELIRPAVGRVSQAV